MQNFEEKQIARDPERILWAAVIMRAALDLVSEDERIAFDAEIFLTGQTGSLDAICDVAEFNFIVIVEGTRRILAKLDSNPGCRVELENMYRMILRKLTHETEEMGELYGI